MNKKVIRDYVNLGKACLFFVLYIPHLICVYSLSGGGRNMLFSDFISSITIVGIVIFSIIG